MDVGAAFVADGEAAVATEPGQRPLHDPAVAAQASAALDASSGDAREDAPAATGLSAVGKVVGLVRMQFAGPSARPADALSDRRDSINHALKELAVVDVRRAEREGKGDAARVGEDVALGPWPAPVRGAGPGLFAPLFAGTLALSRAARRQSMALARPRRSSRTWCRRCQMPACCQSRRRRQTAHPRAAAHLGRQHLPGNAALEHKQDARQRGAARDRRPATLRLRPLRRNQRRNQSPQFIRNKRCCHTPSTRRHLNRSRFC